MESASGARVGEKKAILEGVGLSGVSRQNMKKGWEKLTVRNVMSINRDGLSQKA